MPLQYHIIRSPPIGELAILYSRLPFCIHRIFLPDPDESKWKRHLHPPSFRPGSCAESALWSHRISHFLNGSPDAFGPVPWDQLQTSYVTPLQRKVLAATSRIPFGRTASYSDIARAIDRPKACRFVGTALSKNPFPILIPCHRIIRSDGSPGEFGGGRELKEWLLKMETDALSSRNV